MNIDSGDSDMKSKVIWIFNQAASMLETRHLELGKVFAEKGYQFPMTQRKRKGIMRKPMLGGTHI